MRMRKEYKPSGSEAGVSIEPSWPYYKQLQYLAPFLKHRQTKGNFPEVIEENQSEANDQFQIITIEPMESASNFTGAIETNRECTVDSALSSPSSLVSERVEMPSTETTPSLPGTSKSKRFRRPKADEDTSSEFLMTVLRNTNQFISTASQKGEMDEDELFGQSVGKQLKCLGSYEKSLAKLKIQQVLHEVAWQQEPTT